MNSSLRALLVRRLTCLGVTIGLALLHLTALNAAETDRAQADSTPQTNSFLIPAWAFDRGNVRTFIDTWADGEPMVAFGGRSPILVEYDIEFPASGSYTFHISYAAADARPVDLLLDGKISGQVCRSATRSWNTSAARWEESAHLYIPAGKHTVRLQRSGDFPHVVALRFVSTEIPPNWVVQRPKARKLTDPPPAPPFEPHVPRVEVAALRRAITELAASLAPEYRRGEEFLKRLDALAAQLNEPARADRARSNLVVLQREALVAANPLLGFKRILLVKRSSKGRDLGLPRNWESNSSLPRHGYDDSISVLDLDQPTNVVTLFRPDNGAFVGDLDLDWDADKLLFSSVGTNGRWQVFELAGIASAATATASTSSTTLRQLTGEQPDVDSYDACYLPDDRILFTSTACFIGVPCVYGSAHVATLYRMNADGGNIRQLCFDQEHDWCPTVLNNGRVLYTRWEYADTPHSNTRLLFHMNPDGTEQMEFLGSNSYWPNSFFYARPIPGHPTKVIAVIGGHHDHPRMGELVVFDTARGRQEASPAVQRIPGFGKKVEAIIRDGLTLESWPKFLHPFPLNEKFFLVSGKPTPDAPWGIYLADVFDNLVPLAQCEDAALFEPIPLRATPRPPVIPDKADYTRQDALVVIQDLYAGDGLRGIPRGTVKALRLFTYHYAYQGMGGLLGVVGAEGPWDIKRVLGTVPVNADGSAKFRVPANRPISLQPLDGEGKAIQLMRSWMTAMPGEVVQCAGCHEKQNTAPVMASGRALKEPPADIAPWYGPLRGFSYAREVQPVIDRHCVRCHDGSMAAENNPSAGRAAPAPDRATTEVGGSHRSPLRIVAAPNLRGDVRLTNWSSVTPGNGERHAGKFSVGYFELQRYVRRPGIESDYHVLEPMEFHADTTELVQLLKNGHHGVQLEPESWDRLITWIDLNCPYHGTWGEEIDPPGPQRQRRRELLKLYAGLEDDPEAIPPSPSIAARAANDPPRSDEHSTLNPQRSTPLPGWPFDAAEAQRRQLAADPKIHRTVDLGEGVKLPLVRIPAGEFLMGTDAGEANERTRQRVRIEKPFWMAAQEIDNRTYALFDPAHDSHIEDKNTYQFGVHGYPANKPDQPVVRVSWQEAMAFCQWLSSQTGLRFTLPTEAQWEYACRAGTATPFNFGNLETDFSTHANLADAKLREFASDPYTIDVPLKNPTPYDDWIPKETRFNDGALIAVAPGRYQPNAWGLYDMHGNIAEWTLSSEGEGVSARKIVRGGSWRDRPRRATASFRLAYWPYQRVYNVGLRVICTESAKEVARNAGQSAGKARPR